ncbi:SgcJ/EcaC family oxidoreductase [Actinoplanes sp. LDG1-06]|uniref:SgcJ/EcaC family oxidoreductase n=1 Tax=Paractinoplanes ovalisporus TaxID=2810368 RepID=A0ABS2AK04_9ACTN|nr:SgcJ/EcaC family oxidoreductase [Actinoplanes ovalisporus]MBM2620105.1 SgcJ/EcaC family oxidoreductase [Actinoplanes ovalisporus]
MTESTTPGVADHAAVATIPGRVVQFWAAGDAAGFAGLFTDEGTLILPGVFVQGRAAIEAFLAEAFAGAYKGTRVTGDPIGLRFFGGTVAMLQTDGGFLMGEEETVQDAYAVRASWLLVKQDGAWKLAAYQNSPKFAA